MGPEDAGDWLEQMAHEDPEAHAFAMRTMKPCENCGEMRPKDDPAMRAGNGICYMCQQDPVRGQSPVAGKNLAYFERGNLKKIARLEKLLKENGIEVPDEEDLID
jgi:hypothetical protein